jgi:two-component system CheB/CheR fusion protein
MSDWKTLGLGWRRDQNRQHSDNSTNINLEHLYAQNGGGRPAHQHTDSNEIYQPRAPEHFQSILISSGFPLLVLDHDLRLRFFTPSVITLFKVTASDFGRPLADITRRFADEDLLLDAQAVIATGASLWRNVKTDGGACFDRRLLPYRTGDNEIRGIVISFADVSDMKAAEHESDSVRAYSNCIVDTVRQSLVVLDEQLRIVSANPNFYRKFALKPGYAVGRLLPNLRDRCLDIAALRSFLDRIAAGNDVVEDYAIEIELPPRGRRVLLMNARKFPVLPPAEQRTLVVIDDITDWKHADAALETAKNQAERASEPLR